MRALLDINVIIALLDPDHDFHRRAHEWWAINAKKGWASCPLTQNGVVRILSHPAYNPGRSLTPGAVIALLRAFTAGTDHRFCPDTVSLLDETAIHSGKILGPRQITDLYLLALARKSDCRFVTFDESINRDAIPDTDAEYLVVV